MGNPRPLNFETDYFWNVYVTTGYESGFLQDRDGSPNALVTGTTTRFQNQVTIVFLEAIRDSFPTTRLQWLVSALVPQRMRSVTSLTSLLMSRTSIANRQTTRTIS